MAIELSAYGSVFTLRGAIEDDIEIKSPDVLVSASDGSILIFHEKPNKDYQIEIFKVGDAIEDIRTANRKRPNYVRWSHPVDIIIAPYEQSWILTHDEKE
jgi:hypothetical protein